MVADRNMNRNLMGNGSFQFGTTETGHCEQDLSTDEESSSCFSSSDASYTDLHQGSFQQLSAQLHFRPQQATQDQQSCRFEAGSHHFLPSSSFSSSSTTSASYGHQFPAGLDNTMMQQQNSFCSNNNNNNENNMYTMCSTFPLRSCTGVVSKQTKKKRTTKTVYIPHKDKPTQVVDKRNARERRRVEAVNDAFKRLRKLIPYENRNKRLSKFKTLRIAINYIRNLQDMVREEEEQGSIPECPAPAQWSCDPRQEVVGHHVMSEYKYSSESHDFGYDSTNPMMHQYSAPHGGNGVIYGQYQTSHPGYSSTSPVTMEMNSNVAMEMSTSCNRWTGPTVQLSPHNSASYHQHL